MIYRYKQRSAWLAALVALALLLLWGAAFWDALASTGGWMLALRAAGGTTVALLLVAWTFSSMTILVREDDVEWWFGAGWPRGRIAIADLVDASAARSTPLQGWGIHLTSVGWPWNVRALNAVRLRGAGPRSVLLGTDRPQELLDAIARARWAGAA